ncbi:MAG TPA: family 10 glycosylhydrolase [Candidatus Sulfotelmatobacter sp.]|nr:family 10 glycosylhydrolase [Candidatus Sulfotelmatobacter sp.]
MFKTLEARIFAVCVAALAVAFTTTGAELPATAIIDACDYATDAAAAVWKPMEGSAAPQVTEVAGVKALRLRCNYSSNTGDRAYWQQAKKLDLSDGDGIEFKFLCSNTLPVTFFSIYFQSGNGWYHSDFFPESKGDWNTVSIKKAAMGMEGKTLGWNQIKTIRIAAWRGQNVDTEFYVSDLHRTGGLGYGSSVIVLNSATSEQHWPQQLASFEETTLTTEKALSAAGISAVTITDDQLTSNQLALASLVVLPQDPALPAPVVQMLADYAQHGGKILAFYTLPDDLSPALGLTGGERIKAPQPGAFAKIKFSSDALPGAPDTVLQTSGNIGAWQPAPGAGRVLAEWQDADGKPAGHPAVIATSNSIVMTHVLLPGDDTNKAQMVMAMAASLVPELGRRAVEAALTRAGHVASFTNLDEALSVIETQGAGNAAVAECLDSVKTLRDSARGLAASQHYSEAITKTLAAGKELKRAYYLAQKPLPGEFRAFWCHSPWGVPGMTWDEAIHRLAENGFTTIIPNMLSAGVAYYPSKVLPVSKQVAERGDQVAQCLAACRKYGLQMYAWKLDWNLNGASPEFIDQMRSEHRLQMSDKGKEELWLCPSDPRNQKLEIDAMLELVRNYDLDGIHFDYIRYPGPDYCFCDGCKERFREHMESQGAKVQAWPADALPGGALRQQWLDWRRDNINTVVHAVNDQARALKPNIKIGAAVFRYWSTDRDYVGQDWKMWCDKGWLDFVLPMDYTPSKARFSDMVQQQVAWAGKVPCYPGLGASSSSSHFGADRAIEEIDITRQYKTGGFVIFNYGANETRELLPELGLGLTRPDSPAK